MEAGSIEVVGQDCFGMSWRRIVEQQKKMCQNAADKRDFVIFSMMSVKHSVAPRPIFGEIIKSSKKESNR